MPIQMYFIIVCSFSFAVCSAGHLQKTEMRELAKAVIGPLKNGLQSFNTVSQMLLSVDTDFHLPGSKTFNEIRPEIENMKQELERAEQVAMKELRQMDWDTERLTAEQSYLAGQKRTKEGELGRIQTELNSHKSLLSTTRNALETYRSNLRSAEGTVERMEQKRREAKTLRNVGIGFMFIPVVGQIAGSIMAAVGQHVMDEESDAADRARTEVWDCESRVRSYTHTVSQFESNIRQTENEIQQAASKIHQMAAQLNDLSVKRQVVADIQAKTRGAVRQLGKLNDVGSAAEVMTRHLIRLEAVMNVMEEMTSALGRITGDQLLLAEGIPSLIEEMKKNQIKLVVKTLTTEHYEL